MNRQQQIADALPAPSFAKPPYRAVLFSDLTGWSGVLNTNGVNCLTFKSRPGETLTDFETAQKIADKWNNAA